MLVAPLILLTLALQGEPIILNPENNHYHQRVDKTSVGNLLWAKLVT